MSLAKMLIEEAVPANPFALFAQWYLAAEDAQLPEPSAMTLATVQKDGTPDARMVLMRGLDERGFMFYTNYLSSKAVQLEHHPQAALVFYWASLARQIRILGNVDKLSALESDAYFRARPLGHQLGAWTSPQSEVIPNRQFLEDRLKLLEQQYQGAADVPRPPHWGGYRLNPHTMEFWQGRENRLHDRLRYRLEGQIWRLERLAP